MSSAAVKRSSIGNETGWRSSTSRAARTASTASARGTAYSISSKRTSRWEAKIACDQSTRSRLDATAEAKRFRRGIVPGKRRATSLTARKAWLSMSVSLTYVRARPRLVGGSSVGSCVRVSATSACGKLQNSKWSWASARSCRPLEHLLERLRAVEVAHPEGRHAAQRDRGDDAERADRHARGAQLVAAGDRALAAVGEHELDRLDLARDDRVARAGPVRAGGDRAGQRLGVDVAEVRHREAARVQLARERVQPDAGLDAHEPAGRVGVQHARERVERDAASRP